MKVTSSVVKPYDKIESNHIKSSARMRRKL